MTKKYSFIIPLFFTALLFVGGCSSNQDDSSSIYDDEIKNGSFEEGLTSWTVGGLGGFSEEDVSSIDMCADGQSSEKVGNSFYAGATSSLPSFTGTLTSEPFNLGGIGYISLKLGAAKNGEKCYIEFYEVGKDDTPLSFYLDYDTTTIYTKLTNTDFNGTTIRSLMMRHIVDLREHFEKDIYIKITDNDTGSDYTDYSFVNLDDFKVLKTAQEKNDALVERADQLLQYEEDDIDAENPVEQLRNGGFETGDTSYWKAISGEAFLSKDMVISSTEMYWGNRLYHADGNYFLNNISSGEEKVGKMRSEKFIVTDQGNNQSYATFMIGAAKQPTTYVAINDAETGSELIRVYNNAFKDPGLAQGLVRYYVDLSEYIGQTLYFTIVDNATGDGFAFIEVDDFEINLSQQEVINGIAELRQWANDLDDMEAKSDYISAYNGGISFPISGNAPVVEEENGYALTTTIAPKVMNLNQLFNQVTAVDDYTAADDLVKTIETVTFNGVEIESDYTNFELEIGEYIVSLSFTDAYKNKTTTKVKITVVDGLSYANTIENGDFEYGNLNGWTVVSGNVNTSNAIDNASTFWAEAIPFNKSGEYFFNGWNACEVETDGYSLRSTMFTLGGVGQISFKLGGHSSKLVVRDEADNIIAEYRNYAFADVNFPNVSEGCRLATMNTYVADLSEYIGENLYIEIVDEVISEGWAVAFFDEINVYHEQTINIAEEFDVVEQYGVQTELPWLEAKSN